MPDESATSTFFEMEYPKLGLHVGMMQFTEHSGYSPVFLTIRFRDAITGRFGEIETIKLQIPAQERLRGKAPMRSMDELKRLSQIPLEKLYDELDILSMEFNDAMRLFAQINAVRLGKEPRSLETAQQHLLQRWAMEREKGTPDLTEHFSPFGESGPRLRYDRWSTTQVFKIWVNNGSEVVFSLKGDLIESFSDKKADTFTCYWNESATVRWFLPKPPPPPKSLASKLLSLKRRIF